jgi:hypothetical protein
MELDMNIFIYAPSTSVKGTHLIRDIGELVPRAALEVLRTPESFRASLLRPKVAFSIAIMFLPRTEDLKALAPIRESIRETKMILILADQEKETVSLAHLLFPTYISYVENDYRKTISVVRTLIDVHERSLNYGSA